jgi:hypothetical protein
MKDPENFKQRIKQEIILTAFEKGVTVVEVHEDIYGWADNPATKHINGNFGRTQKCEIHALENATVEENYVAEFTDTINPANEQMFIDIDHVSCACGQVSDRKVRYSGTFSEFLAEILKD